MSTKEGGTSGKEKEEGGARSIGEGEKSNDNQWWPRVSPCGVPLGWNGRIGYKKMRELN